MDDYVSVDKTEPIIWYFVKSVTTIVNLEIYWYTLDPSKLSSLTSYLTILSETLFSNIELYKCLCSLVWLVSFCQYCHVTVHKDINYELKFVSNKEFLPSHCLHGHGQAIWLILSCLCSWKLLSILPRHCLQNTKKLFKNYSTPYFLAKAKAKIKVTVLTKVAVKWQFLYHFN